MNGDTHLSTGHRMTGAAVAAGGLRRSKGTPKAGPRNRDRAATAAISCADVAKHYGDLRAVDGCDICGRSEIR